MIKTTEIYSDRHVVLSGFDDGGLSTGPRHIFLCLPDGYEESAERYPVVYFNDGGNTFSGGVGRMDVDLAYDSLIEDGLIGPVLFVGIGIINVPARFRSLTPTVQSSSKYAVHAGGGGLDGYYRFISERLKPYIDDHYRTMPEPASTGIAGYSLGGLAAFLMAYEHPETFGLAGCMSPSLYWDDEYALRLVRGDAGGRKPVRFWLDGGGGEYDTWSIAARAYGLLERRGWRAGDDLAAYFDYPADHNFEGGARRMREMLHFLLRKEPLRVEDYRLVYAADPPAPAMDLNTGHRRIVGAEAWYAGGLRLTVPQPDLAIEDTDVVTLDATDPLLLHGVGPGETTISSTYHGHTAALRVIGSREDLSSRDLPCPPTHAAPDVRADAAAWADLPHAIMDDDQNTVARLGVSHDAGHVHIAVEVRKALTVIEPSEAPEERENLVIVFDAGPESHLRKGDPYGDEDEFLAVRITPGKPGEQSEMYRFRSDDWGPVVPAEIRSAWAAAPGGWRAALSIPVDYIDQAQGGPWRVFRLNIAVNTVGAGGGPLIMTSWQLDWKKFAGPIGSGIFRKT